MLPLKLACLLLIVVSSTINIVQAQSTQLTKLQLHEAPSTARISLSKDGEANTCKVPGMMCQTCTKLVMCLNNFDDSMITEEVKECTGATTCSSKIHNCTTEPNPACAPKVEDYKFICVQVGTFPDPYTCNRYYICTPKDEQSVNPEPVQVTCPTGLAYDPLTTLCSVKIETKGCKLYVPECKAPGQTGRIEENPSYYYMCLTTNKKLFPRVFVCSGNLKYNGLKCEDPSPASATGADGLCIARGLFDDPTDCKSYIDCADKNRPVLKRPCPVGTRFSFKDQRCVTFTC